MENKQKENNTIKAHKLPHSADISAVRLNQIYIGKILPNKLVSLNKHVKGKLINKDKLDKEDSMIPVKVVKITLPYGLELEYLEGKYELVEKTHDIASFSLDDVGREFRIHALLESIKQTSGPTIFTLFDGSGTISAKSFAGAGNRAFPELEEGMAISAMLQLMEYDNNLEAELVSFKRLEESKGEQLKRKIKGAAEEKAMPSDVEFFIKSDILDKLKPKIMLFAKIVKKAILESRPIILRHHADCDGYCGGIALERAILPLIIENHNNSRACWQYYRRAPSKAPFYEYADVVKDLTHSLDNKERFGRKEPLVILVDNGGTEEDIPGIKKMKLYGAQIIVADHHYPGEKDENGNIPIDPYVDVNVTPHAVGGDGNYTAGMLAAEIARFINNEVRDIEILPALAGVGDRSKGDEFTNYLRIAEDKGFSHEYLKKLAKTIDFEAYYLRFIESRGLVNDLLGADINKQKELVELMLPDMTYLEQEQLKASKHYSVIDEKESVVIARLDIGKVNRRGSYPAAGKATGMLHDWVVETRKKPVITLSSGPDFITVRATEDVKGFNIHDLLKELREKVPHGFIEGGGHENAGTVKFIGAAKEDVMVVVDGYVNRF